MKSFFILLLFIFPTVLFSQENSEPISPCVSEFHVPNSFSGYGDQMNDIFIPKLSGAPASYEFMVFNRWGEVIFKTNQVTDGWNGKYKDSPVSSEVYVWQIVFTCSGSEEKYQFIGEVTLIR